MFGRVVGFVGTASLALAPAMFVSATSAGAAPVSEVFAAVGSHDWVVPAGVSCVTAEAIGAEGGSFPEPVGDLTALGKGNGNGTGAQLAGDGAQGGSGTTTFGVVPGSTLQVNVGGRGGDVNYVDDLPAVGGAGGFNGGGNGGTPTSDDDQNGYSAGAGGGGASDVRVGGTSLDDRLAVGGGGGGFGGFGGEPAGVGGGDAGGDGGDQTNSTGGKGGTDSAGGAGGQTHGTTPVGEDGSFGQGGAGAGDATTNGSGGGGGGGWYGGGGGGGVRVDESAAAGGGGGSGLGFDSTDSDVDAGNGGNGKVTLTYEVGDTSCLAAPLTIKKVANGPTTPGQTFTVHVSCPGGTIAQGETGLTDVDLVFTVDGAGAVQPSTGQTIGFLEQTDCTVTETGTGGATSVSYQCAGSGAGTEVDAASGWGGVGAATAENPDDPCQTSGPQSTPISLDIVRENQNAMVTVTNTMPAAAAVLVTPRFTG
jgi:hypothetical protein